MCISLNHEHIFSINENLRKKIKIFYVSLCHGRMDGRKSGIMMGSRKGTTMGQLSWKDSNMWNSFGRADAIRERPKRSCGCYKNFTNSVTHLMLLVLFESQRDDVFSCSIESWSDVGWSTLSLSYTRNLIITDSAICLTLTRRLLGWDFAFAIWRVF